MSESPQQFEALLLRVQEGDEAALAELVEQHIDVIRRAARGLLGQVLRPHLDSVDLIQSLHCALLVGLRDNKFDISTPDKLIALSLTLIRRNIARRWRKLKNHPGTGTVRTDSDTLAEVPADRSGPDPARQLILNEAMAQVLSSLDESDRRLVELRLQGLGTPEIAQRLGISAAHLRVRWSRLRKRLREEGLLDEQD